MTSTIKRITWKGNLGDTDIFMFGVAAQTELDPVDAYPVVVDASETCFNGQFGGGVVFTNVRIAEIIESTGLEGDSYEGPLTTITQGGGGAMLPSEVAMCVTVRTVGTSGVKGRFYLPPPTVGRCVTNGRLDATYQASVIDKLYAMWQTDLGDATVPIRLGVYSKRDHAFYGANRIELGNVFDSQRRRRNKLVEARLAHNIA